MTLQTCDAVPSRLSLLIMGAGASTTSASTTRPNASDKESRRRGCWSIRHYEEAGRARKHEEAERIHEESCSAYTNSGLEQWPR